MSNINEREVDFFFTDSDQWLLWSAQPWWWRKWELFKFMLRGPECRPND